MEKDGTKIQGCIHPGAMIKIINFITVIGFTGVPYKLELAYCLINIVWNKDSVCCFCLNTFYPLLYLFTSFLFLFSSYSIDHPLFQYICVL